MKYFIIMIYIQEHLSGSGEVINDPISQWILFVVHKLTSSCMKGFMFTGNYNYTTDTLKNPI